jgi:hypothetical protein
MEVSGQLHAPADLPPGKSPWFPLDRRLGGPQSRSGHGGGKKKFPAPSPRRESNPRTPIVQPVVQRYIDWAIMALRICMGTEKNQYIRSPTSDSTFFVYLRRLLN